MAAINRGDAERVGSSYRVHGRLYGTEPGGTTYPIAGPGFFRLDRGAYKALGVYNALGITPRAEEILDKMAISTEARDAAVRVLRAERGEQ